MAVICGKKLHLEQVNIRKRLNKFVWIKKTFVQTAEFWLVNDDNTRLRMRHGTVNQSAMRN